MPVKIRHPYDDNYDPKSYSLSGFEPTLTKQSDAKAADINIIVKKWMNEGAIPANINKGIAQYFDTTSIPDYQGCMDIVIQAQQAFNSLPSFVRERFSNDPAKFLDFASDPANIPEMVSLGLAEPSTGAASASNAGDAAPVGGS